MSTQQNAPMFRAQQPPCGVTLMGFFLLIQGLFQIAVWIFGLFGLAVLIFDVSRGGALLAHGLLSGILGIVSVIFSIGLFMLRPWAFWGVVLIAALNLINSMIILTQTNFASWTHIFNAILSLIILFYFLTNSSVRTAFR